MMERPTTPTKDMQEAYQGSPAVGTPGRVTDEALDDKMNDDKPVTFVKFTDINMALTKKIGGKIGIKGRVEKTASLAALPGAPSKSVKFFAVNICDNEIPMHKLRVSAFADYTKWLSSFSGGSMVAIEDPIILPLQSRYLNSGVNIKYEIRLHAPSKVTVEVDNSYVHAWTSIDDLISNKVQSDASVSVRGVACDISDIVTYTLPNGSSGSADRELHLKSEATGSSIRVALHGHTAKEVSCTEENVLMFFGPLKVWDGIDEITYLETIPYESKRCDSEGKTYVAPKKQAAAVPLPPPTIEVPPVDSSSPVSANMTPIHPVNAEVVDLTVKHQVEEALNTVDAATTKKHDVEDVQLVEKKVAMAVDVPTLQPSVKVEKMQGEEKKHPGRKSKKEL